MGMFHRFNVYFSLSMRVLTYLTFRKIKNYIQARGAYELSRWGINRVNHLPCFISVEPAAICNLRCPECPVGTRSTPLSKPTLINPETYHRVIDELSPVLTHVIFYFQGEPFLNRNLSEMIGYAHQKLIFTSTSTNGHYITDEIAQALIASGLDKLIVSVDGVTQEVYAKYRIGGSLETVVQGIQTIVKWKNELKSLTPFIELQMVVTAANEHQISKLRQLKQTTGADKYTLKPAQIYNFENGSPLIPKQKKYSRYKAIANGKYKLKHSLHNRCMRAWSGAVIDTQGDVLPCCFDKNSSYAYGHLTNVPFAEVYHSRKANAFRSEILNNRNQYEMCRNCTGK